MNIVMTTNTYKPIVGGLERSVEVLSGELRKRGHRVLIIAPESRGQPEEDGVFRVPAIQNFNGTDFSVEVPISLKLNQILKRFAPDIVHTHHPFLIGDTAQRISAQYQAPIVFTHHTLYEEYTHYVPGDADMLKNFVIRLSTGYANLCDRVLVPSQSVERLLKKRGVRSPVSVAPTGIYTREFERGDGKAFRESRGIPPKAFVVGYAGRVAPEKNMEFWVRAAGGVMRASDDVYCLVAGDGPTLGGLKERFCAMGLEGRVALPGILKGRDLADAYHAMDVFAFCSHSETQGLVLAEAMAAGVPVAAVDAPGVREVVRDKVNGRMIARDDTDDFVRAVQWLRDLPAERLEQVKEEARRTAGDFAVDKSVEKIQRLYEELIVKGYTVREIKTSPWREAMGLVKREAELVLNMTRATAEAVANNKPKKK